MPARRKYLGFWKKKKVTPLGSEKPILADTRIIAATNKNLPEMMTEKKFREDLYYRLCGIEIMIPSLCERVEDIPLLALHFVKRAHIHQKRTSSSDHPLRLSSEALNMLMVYPWPGNVRQLEQALFAAAALCEGNEITPANLPAWLNQSVTSGGKEHAQPLPVGHHPDLELSPGRDRRHFKNVERMRYLEALQATQYRGSGRWNVSSAARRLDIPRETLVYHLKKLSLSR